MMYPFISFPDGTEIVFSHIMKDEDGNPTIKVYVEQWNDAHDDFDRLEFYIPSGKITENVGFDKATADKHYNALMGLQDVMFDYAQEHDPRYISAVMKIIKGEKNLTEVADEIRIDFFERYGSLRERDEVVELIETIKEDLERKWPST